VCVVEESLQDAGSLDAVLPISHDDSLKRNAHSKTRRQNPDIWSVQENPIASELRVLSQPTDVPKWQDVPNFVYQKQAGQGVFVYHVEYGINTDNDVSGIRNFSLLRHQLIVFHLGSKRQSPLYNLCGRRKKRSFRLYSRGPFYLHSF